MDRLPAPVFLGFPRGSAGKESTCNVGDQGSIPGLGRSPGEEEGYPLQCSGLENFMDCTVHGVILPASLIFFFIIFKIYLFNLWLCWVFVAERGLSLVVACGVLLSKLRCQASHSGGLSVWNTGSRQ